MNRGACLVFRHANWTAYVRLVGDISTDYGSTFVRSRSLMFGSNGYWIKFALLWLCSAGPLRINCSGNYFLNNKLKHFCLPFWIDWLWNLKLLTARWQQKLHSAVVLFSVSPSVFCSVKKFDIDSYQFYFQSCKIGVALHFHSRTLQWN